MKSLVNYLNEAADKKNQQEEENNNNAAKEQEKKETNTDKKTKEQDDSVTVEDEHVVTFDFSGLEGAEDIIKKIDEIGTTEVSGNRVTLTAKKNDISAISDIHDLITDFVETLRKSQKRYTDENYAQKIKAFATTLEDLDNYVEEVNNEEK